MDQEGRPSSGLAPLSAGGTQLLRGAVPCMGGAAGTLPPHFFGCRGLPPVRLPGWGGPGARATGAARPVT